MMSTPISHDHHNKFHHYLTKKNLREIDIPPRKQLLSRHHHLDSPKAEDAVFSKFLPYNNTDIDDDDSDDPYSSDHFRMYEFKVRKCNRSRSHDWTDCPFAHPGEKARRRDPRRYHYSGTICSEFRKGACSKGDNCEFSHGVFECWLHPTRYRTEACKDGKNCKRKICFFAHSTRQLRMVSDPASPPSINSPRYRNNLNNCCVFCHTMTQSPTSTLMGGAHVSPAASPPVSPPPEYSLYGYGAKLSYKDAVNEVMASFEGMNLKDHHVGCGNRNLAWLDVNGFGVDEQPQFVMSPSTPNPSPMFGRGGSSFSSGGSNFSSGESNFFRGDFSGRNLMEDGGYNNESNNLAGPDLGWVNDLLT